MIVHFQTSLSSLFPLLFKSAISLFVYEFLLIHFHFPEDREREGERENQWENTWHRSERKRCVICSCCSSGFCIRSFKEFSRRKRNQRRFYIKLMDKKGDRKGQNSLIFFTSECTWLPRLVFSLFRFLFSVTCFLLLHSIISLLSCARSGWLWFFYFHQKLLINNGKDSSDLLL